ncbi:ribonuclease 3-like [Rhopilema esculentum]|uniref:ribonuclease 3-like n=1 Tax=Rhopilema esculentum TaxID=499914 RepID=UPI0031E1587C
MEESHRRLHEDFCSFLSEIQKLKKEGDSIYCSQPLKGYLQQDSQNCSGKITSRVSQEPSKREIEGRKQYQRTSLKTKIQIDKIEETLHGNDSDEAEADDNGKSLHDSRLLRPLNNSLPYNTNKEGFEGQNCQCKDENKKRWVVHKKYKGEQSVPRCEPSTNNEDTLYCYRISVNPDINFKARFPTEICHRGDIYEFDGFLLLTHCLLERVPKCSFTYFKRLYSITLHSENIPKKFCIKDLELFHKLVFEEYFEISDWNISGIDALSTLFTWPL